MCSRLDDVSFWTLDGGKQTVSIEADLDVRKCNWLAQLDAEQLRRLGFNDQAGFGPKQVQTIACACVEVNNAIDDNMVLKSSYTIDRGGITPGFSPTAGRVAELPSCMRAFLLDRSELRLAPGAVHGIVRAVAAALGVQEATRSCVWEELVDRRVLGLLANERRASIDAVARDLEGMWSSHAALDYPEGSDYHMLRHRAARIRNALYEKETLRPIRKLVETRGRDDERRKGSFLELLVAHVVRRLPRARPRHAPGARWAPAGGRRRGGRPVHRDEGVDCARHRRRVGGGGTGLPRARPLG